MKSTNNCQPKTMRFCSSTELKSQKMNDLIERENMSIRFLETLSAVEKQDCSNRATFNLRWSHFQATG
uniref:Uncharacterized protein n=1 Tax=Anguilla anguilla TaxID=7936 RepID=A0A0E9W924_ANGAN